MAELRIGEKPRQRPRKLMHMIDAGVNPYVGFDHIAEFKCKSCGFVSEWTPMPTITSIKRGLPCPQCNAAPKQEQSNG